MTPRSWTLVGGAAFLTFDINITFRSGPIYDCSCCKYIQWVNGTYTFNGQVVPRTKGGTPLDGTYHIDSWDYTNDEDTNPTGGAYADSDASPCGWHSTDQPGLPSGIRTDDSISVRYDFLGNVIDTCNGNVAVAGQTLSMSISGTYPGLTVSPQIP